MATLSAPDRKIQRCVWLALKLGAQQHQIAYDEFAARFGATIRTYHRDLNVLRRIGFTIVSHRDHSGNVRCTGVAL